MAEWWLRHVQAASRVAEVLFLGDSDEMLHVTKIHVKAFLVVA
ncbi:hypothetical protein NSU_2281 [Novosphingobium pentaromativorans US6-1]|uniref:Uncharacterized protein n=1 Tax=Novosphingobium pentaromativorans US6-1 TaxID=1088721 RepID=G6ED60_9SPHN|nr:hypothetical protein NSU_2281 [Novosphingobium pentaromativorans US6-1]